MDHQIAFLACAGTLPASPTRRADAHEHDHQVAALRAGLQGRGIALVEVDWRAPIADLARFPLALLGTPWDYAEAKDEFLAHMGALESAGVQVCNPLDVLRWNADKLYLRDLARRGAATIPTLWPEAPGPGDIAAAFDHFGCDRVVAKRRVGAGAVGQHSFTRNDPAIAAWRMDQPAMIQPFLPAIEQEGEFSFIFVDGQFSHALIKRAPAGEYRVQSVYGGMETAITPAPGDRAAAEAVMALLPFAHAPLYARIDMVRLPHGALAVIEAELIEPYLYPLQGPQFGTMMAEALQHRLALR